MAEARDQCGVVNNRRPKRNRTARKRAFPARSWKKSCNLLPLSRQDTVEAMNSSSFSHCPKCGAEIPAGAPQGVCPRCLMQQAMQPTAVLSDPPVAPPDAEI